MAKRKWIRNGTGKAKAGAGIIAACFCLVTPARSFPMGDVTGQVVAGPIFGSGDASTLDDGLGKLRAGNERIPIATDATLVWAGSISEQIRAVAAVDISNDSQPVVGLSEMYLKFRPARIGAWRVSGRAGLFFPPVSLEHDGADWSLSRTLTPSAANTWIGEEVKAVGVEVSIKGDFGKQPLSFTGAVFSSNDTSGSLLAFRGWALHDVKAAVGSTFALAEVPAMFTGVQASRTRPVDEVDGRLGSYGKLEWSTAEILTVSLFGYDNNGDEVSVTKGHYAWRTRFAQLAVDWDVTDKTEVLVQVMTGESRMGGGKGSNSPANVGFFTTYGLVSRDFGQGTAAARVDYFAVSDRSFRQLDNNAENGWSATLAWTQPLNDRTHLVFESVLVASDRPDRSRFGIAREQSNTQARVAVRSVF